MAAFAEAFPEQPSITPATVLRAIATYERSLISPLSHLNDYVASDASALSPDAQLGLALVIGRARCATWHTGRVFTNGGFHDVGLTDNNPGRGSLTVLKFNEHRFRKPILNVLGVADRREANAGRTIGR